VIGAVGRRQLDARFALDEPGLARSVDQQSIRRGRLLVDNRDRAGIAAADRRDGERKIRAVPIVAEWLEAFTAGQARCDHVGIVQQCPHSLRRGIEDITACYLHSSGEFRKHGKRNEGMQMFGIAEWE